MSPPIKNTLGGGFGRGKGFLPALQPVRAQWLAHSIRWIGAGLSLCCTASVIAASAPTSITLTATPNPALYGQIATLTAAVSSASATGNVTFYDGVTVLGTRSLAGGLATLFTILLPSGTRSLSAYYRGDANYSASTSATVSQTVNTVPGLFQAAVSVNANYGGAVVVGDFNGDGKADLALGGTGTAASVVLLGNGDGSFEPPIRFNVGHCFFPRTLALGDFNGDGKPDLAVGESCSGVNILLGNGDGTFQPPVSYATGGNPPFIAVGDFNGDGKADLALADECFGTLCVSTSMLLGNGDGTFRTGVSYNFTGSSVVGDFNGDGKADLVTGGGVHLGNGDGTFRGAQTFSPVNNYCFVNCGINFIPASVVVGDFNGDGKADLVIPGSLGSAVSVLLGNGDGTLRTATNYTVGNNPQSIAIGDFNGDGKADIAVTCSNGVNVLSGNGDGSFRAATNYATGLAGGFGSIAVGAFKGDGRAGVAFTAAVYSSSGSGVGLSVLLGTGPAPDLTIAKTHTGNFTQGQSGATYTITISNIGSASTSGAITVTDTLPAGLVATGISGPGWNCVTATATCTRLDALATSANYPAIAVTVTVAANAPVSVNNTATVSGGGETNSANDTASDPTHINITGISQTITFAPLSDQPLGTSAFALAATASSGLLVGFVSNTNTVCTVSRATVTLIAIGTCSITATQGGNANYAAAPPVSRSFAIISATTRAQIGGGICTNAVLNGTYFYLLAGSIASGSQFSPYAEMGKLVANGNGGIAGQSSASVNGVLGTYSLTGTYSVQGTCAGSLTLTVNSQSTGTLTFQVVNSGQGINLAVSTPGIVATGRAYRQTASITGATQCGSGSLTGSYGYLLTGVVRLSGNNSLLYADGGQVVSDGNGNLSMSSVANLNGAIAATTGTGSYTVAGDCSGEARVTNANGTINYLFALVQDAQSALFLGSDSGYTIAGTAQPQFAVPQQAVVNSGGFAPQSLSAGSLFSIFGVGLSQQTASAQALPLPRTLASTQVLVNGLEAPLFYVGPGQINAQMPLEVPAGTPVSVIVSNAGKSSNNVTVGLVLASPGVFTYGNNQAVVQNPDGTLNSDAAPAHPGDVLVGYLTGGGPVNRAGPLLTGSPSPNGPSQITSGYSVTVGGQDADVLYLGLAPSLVGVYQVNFKLPVLAAGRYPLAIIVNSVASNGPTISVGR